MSELLTVQNLSKNYGSKQALKNVSLSVSRGRIVGLLGPNGSGKTTMLKLINGLLRPSAVSYTHLDVYKRQDEG